MNNSKPGARTNDCRRDLSETDLLIRRVTNEKKKSPNEIVDRKPDHFDCEIVPNSRERENSKSRSAKKDLVGVKKLKNIDNEVFVVNQLNNRNSKSILKLPNINSKPIIGKSSNQKDSMMASSVDTSSQNENYNKASNGKEDSQEKKFSVNDVQEKVDNPASSFLKYINVKPIKPSGRSPQRSLDRSIRDLRLNKLQQTIKQDLRNTKTESIRKGIKQEQRGRTHDEQQRREPHSQKVAPLNQINDQEPTRSKKTFSITTKITSQPSTATSNTMVMVQRKKRIRTTYLDFCLFMSLINRMGKPEQPTGTYKAYVGKGNNSVMVKNVLKNRFWWNILSEPDSECNLTWAQGRDTKLIQSMMKWQEGEKKTKSRTKIQFMIKLPSKEEGKVNPFKEHSRNGLSKLISSSQKLIMGRNDYQVDIPAGQYYQLDTPNRVRMHNHLEFNWNLCNKKALFYNLKGYYNATKQDPFQFIPLTFHIHHSEGHEWDTFARAYIQREKQIKEKKCQGKKKGKNLWIIKPGQNSNQGCGIEVSDSVSQIQEIIRSSENREKTRTRSFIVQKYLIPFLYCKRKFDIRCYMLVTSVNSIVKAYWYEEGYIRTSSREFSIKDIKNKMIHLTNDAIQKKSEQYGKFQNGNKVSFADFQRYLDTTYGEKAYNFYDKTYPEMMKLAADSVKSTLLLLDSNKREFCFEVFGLDFMIDQEFHTWLIEVNNNPCLSLSSPLLARLIPNMIENAVRIAVDPFFPPPVDPPKSKMMPSELFQANKFTLIFNSTEEGQNLVKVLKNVELIQEECEEDEQQENIEDIQ